jgi:hypothetical protein
MMKRRVSILTTVVVALATTITTQSFAHDRGAGATPAAGANAGAIQGTFTTSDAVPWKPVDPKHPGLEMFAVWGNPNEGASLMLQKFPAGMDSGWHTYTAAYQGISFTDRNGVHIPGHVDKDSEAMWIRIPGGCG